MCIGGSSSSVPTPPPALPEAGQLPEQSLGRGSASADKRRRVSATGDTGASGTILTGPRGVTQQGATATKTLLGQ